MAGLRDGLGFEELGQAGSQVASLFMTGSVTTDSQVSGLNIYANGSVVGNRINDSNGVLFSASVGSPATYGVKIQTGSISTGAGSTATVEFGQAFANTNWHIVFSPASGGGVEAGSVPAGVAGTKNVSGAAIIGGPSQAYDFIAIGL